MYKTSKLISRRKLAKPQKGLFTPLGGVTVPALAQAFKSALFAGGSDKVLTFLGDSTGNGQDEHFYLLTLAFEAADLTHYVDYYLYNDATKAYIWMGLLGRQSTYAIMQETFARADGSVGTTSSGGQTWSVNSWSISSGLAVPSATSAGLIAAALLASTSFKMKADVKFPSSGAHRIYTLTAGSSTAKYLAVFVDSVGAVSLVCQDGTGAVTLATMNSLAATVGNLYTITIVKDGLNVWVQFNGPDLATVGGPRQMVGTLTSAQDAALTGRNVQFLVVGTVTGQALDNVSIGDMTKPANRLLVRNGSVSGTGFSYHETNIATLIPEKSDLAVVSLGHNESSTPTQFVLDYQTYIAAVRTQAGTQIPVVATIQNPRTDASATAHASRMAALKPACQPNGWDRIDTFAAFSAYAGGVAALLNVDGIHPNPTLGSPLWLQTDKARFGLT